MPATAAVVALGIAGCSSSSQSSGSSGSSSQTFHLTLSTDITPTLTINNLVLNALNNAAKVTGGKLTIKTYDSSSLYSSQALALSAAERGQLDMVYTSTGQALTALPAMDGPNLGFLAPTPAQYFKLVGPGEPWFAVAAQQAAAKGLTLLPIIPTQPGDGGVAATSKTPISSLASLKNTKIRVPGAGLLADELTAVGAIPVALSPTDTPTQLESGAISAAFGSATFAGNNLKGIAHGFFDTGTFQLAAYYMWVNTKVWQKIPATVQREFINSVNSALESYMNKFTQENATAESQLKAAGDWVTDISSAETAKYQQQFASTVWPKFGSEDKAAYDALMQGRKDLGL